MRGLGCAVLAMLVTPALGAQAGVRARLEGRVPAPVVLVVDSLAADAAARALPTEPLVQKALEGGAKGVPADRIIAAVRTVHARLAVAAAALQSAGAAPAAAAVEAGAFALTAGLSADDVRALAQAAAGDPVLALRVGGTLAALGVPAEDAVALVVSTVQTEGGDVATLPQAVQSAISRGATPAQAARLSQGRGQSGEPHGPPPDRPSRPKQNRP
jgi:hypothetical protein